MSVYVDDMFANYGRMKMCHMIADTPEELHAMAEAIGVKRKWCQNEGTPKEHYDICKSMRTTAIILGAKPITLRKLAGMTRSRQNAKQTS